jgi:2-polyprenyl-6-methoxyphenol hydroxylase-like FAD-dependent oxidoreductase
MLSSLLLARSGHQVTVIERDHNELPITPDEAFTHWDRTGAPHARQSHALLARLRSILRTHASDVLDAMYEWGATELTLERLMPPTISDRTARDGDDELVLLACRRLTLEWVMRRAVMAETSVTWRSGSGVRRLAADGTHVHGVVLEDGATVPADLVVVAGGRRSPVMSWINELGGSVQPTEELHELGIVYYSRFYRLLGDAELPVLGGMGAGGDLGYLKFGGFYGDNRSFSVTLCAWTDDVEMRKLSRNEPFEAALRRLPALEPWMAGGLAEPITDVQSMARLRNRIRRFVVDGAPVATGLAVIGDAAIATNPLYGKGCTTGGIAAVALTECVNEHGTDLDAFAHALHARLTSDVEPHYTSSQRQDAGAAAVRHAEMHGTPADPAAAGIRDFIVNGLIPATRVDPDVFRAFFRGFNLLESPEVLMADPRVLAACQAAYAEKDSRPAPPALGPDRAEMIGVLAGVS